MMDFIKEISDCENKKYSLHRKLFFLLALFSSVYYAYLNRFIQDDAFISFRYADNWVRGYGLVYNIGERVEGFTNFLYTVWSALPLVLHLDPIDFHFAVGMILVGLTLVFAFKLAQILTGSYIAAIALMLLVGFNYSFSSYATGGLATQHQTLCSIILVYLLAKSAKENVYTNQRAVAISILSAIVLMTRLDSAIVVCSVMAAFLYLAMKNLNDRAKFLKNAYYLIIPFVLIISLFFLFKFYYYGDLLPNTFYAKTQNVSHLSGVLYIILFFQVYFLWPFIVVLISAIFTKQTNKPAAVWVILLIVLLWFGYIVKVGGDFMEFRFLVPMLPLMMVLFVWASFTFKSKYKILLILFALTIAVNFYYDKKSQQYRFPFNYFGSLRHIETVYNLNSLIRRPNANLETVGKNLAEIFNNDESITIATGAAGAIPFYSRFRTIDMYGLNDAWVARNGKPIGADPGHQRIATLQYLIDKKVNLVFTNPMFLTDSEKAPNPYNLKDVTKHFWLFFEGAKLPETAKVLEIPVTGSHRMPVLYLFPHQAIENAILQNGWKPIQILKN